MTAENIRRYTPPQHWAHYDTAAVTDALVMAKTAAGILRQLPYLPQWIEQAREEQLRLEAVGTSRIEGAEFTEQEQEAALNRNEGEVAGLTRSQRQLRCADATYRWLMREPADRPITAGFILDIHRSIVSGCDDDYCEPGALRREGWNVLFRMPQCRGVEGGVDCQQAFGALVEAIEGEFRQCDGIIQAIAAHYHIGAMHPFGDGNGRTARALEAFMLRRAGVNDLIMVSLSNYYYIHQDDYRAALSECRRLGHNLTPLLRFALPAVAERCNAAAEEIIGRHRQMLFQQFARSLFGKLRSPRRRALGQRQLHILDTLLETAPLNVFGLLNRTAEHYQGLRHPERAQIRDIINLNDLGAIAIGQTGISVNLDWPQRFAESELLGRLERMPSAVSANHPAMEGLAELLGRRR